MHLPSSTSHHPVGDVSATMPPVCDFTVFGGTGDLALRKLLPALYHRDLEGHLPEDTRIIGVSRSEIDDEGYRAEVRAALVAYQRDFARRPGGAVLDGRDIGTVICPQAEVKLYVTASDAVRAERRYLELVDKDPAVTRGQVLADLRARDARDAGRAAAPLKPAADAMLLDTSGMAIEQAVAAAIARVRARRAS